MSRASRTPSVPVPVASVAAGRVQPLSAVPAYAGVHQWMRRIGTQASNVWLPALAWWVGLTGRAGLAGLALLGASAVFLISTHLPMAQEVQKLRAELTEAQMRANTTPLPALSEPAKALQSLPARTDVPQVLGILLKQADAAQLTIDTAKYEISATKAGSLVRYRISFPIDGPYPQVRRFIDATLNAIPALAIDDLSISRKAVSDNAVEAQLRMTIFSRGSP